MPVFDIALMIIYYIAMKLIKKGILYRQIWSNYLLRSQN
jgi:hypothetical protein